MTSAILQTNYGLRGIGRSAPGLATAKVNSSGNPGEQQAWMAGGTFNYEILRNLLLTLDYQYTVEVECGILRYYA